MQKIIRSWGTLALDTELGEALAGKLDAVVRAHAAGLERGRARVEGGEGKAGLTLGQPSMVERKGLAVQRGWKRVAPLSGSASPTPRLAQYQQCRCLSAQEGPEPSSPLCHPHPRLFQEAASLKIIPPLSSRCAPSLSFAAAYPQLQCLFRLEAWERLPTAGNDFRVRGGHAPSVAIRPRRRASKGASSSGAWRGGGANPGWSPWASAAAPSAHSRPSPSPLQPGKMGVGEEGRR